MKKLWADINKSFVVVERYILRSNLKDVSHSASLSSSGREFQTEGPGHFGLEGFRQIHKGPALWLVGEQQASNTTRR